MATFFAGFGLSLSLIFAIGAQNAFILRQGLLQQHVFKICIICSVSDAILIVAGIVGLSAILEMFPGFEHAMRWGGAVFLGWYGARSAMSAWKGGSALLVDGMETQNARATVVTALAITWLNPHVYLDTVVLLGTISAQYANTLVFGAGAVIASFTFFFSLGYGARLLRPLFSAPAAWRVLDSLIAVIMWTIAVSLVWS